MQENLDLWQKLFVSPTERSAVPSIALVCQMCVFKALQIKLKVEILFKICWTECLPKTMHFILFFSTFLQHFLCVVQCWHEFRRVSQNHCQLNDSKKFRPLTLFSYWKWLSIIFPRGKLDQFWRTDIGLALMWWCFCTRCCVLRPPFGEHKHNYLLRHNVKPNPGWRHGIKYIIFSSANRFSSSLSMVAFPDTR